VTKNYWWSGVTRDVKKYMNRCDIYQKMKNQTEALDFITKLLLITGKDAILVVCNKLSKMIYFAVTTEETLAE